MVNVRPDSVNLKETELPSTRPKSVFDLVCKSQPGWRFYYKVGANEVHSGVILFTCNAIVGFFMW